MEKTVRSSDFQRGKTGVASFISAWLRKKEILSTKYVGEVSKETFSPHPYSLSDGFSLQKEPGRDFVILNFTDPHFADYDIRTWMAIPATRTKPPG